MTTDPQIETCPKCGRSADMDWNPDLYRLCDRCDPDGVSEIVRDALARRLEAAETALRYAIDCIESPDLEFSQGKDIYDANMMRGAMVRARANFAAHPAGHLENTH